MIETDIIADQPVQIVPLGDLHIGSKQCDMQAVKSTINDILLTKDKYCILLGDLCDTALKNSKTDIYDAQLSISEQLALVERLLQPLADAGKILAMVSGNHENRVSREVGIDFSKVIAQDIGIEHLYRKELAFLKLRINPKQGYHYPVYAFAVTHSNGGGNVAFINKNQQFGNLIEGLDCLITGHTHKPVVSAPSKMVVNLQTGTVSVRPYYCVSSTSFLEYGGYAVEKMLQPSSILPQTIICGHLAKKINIKM